jgi:hypothetical protein
MVNNYTNINKPRNHLSPQIVEPGHSDNKYKSFFHALYMTDTHTTSYRDSTENNDGLVYGV